MRPEDDELDYLEQDQRVFDEKLERDGGVFVEPQRMQVDCNSEPGSCAPDDYPEDPYGIDNRPGTPDDAGYSFGLTTRDAADRHVIAEGGSRPRGPAGPDVDSDSELGQADEDELWRQMKRLVDEDEVSGLRLPEGVSEEHARRIADSTYEQGEDTVGGSATGEADADLEHGGFPTRDA